MEGLDPGKLKFFTMTDSPNPALREELGWQFLLSDRIRGNTAKMLRQCARLMETGFSLNCGLHVRRTQSFHEGMPDAQLLTQALEELDLAALRRLAARALSMLPAQTRSDLSSEYMTSEVRQRMSETDPRQLQGLRTIYSSEARLDVRKHPPDLNSVIELGLQEPMRSET